MRFLVLRLGCDLVDLAGLEADADRLQLLAQAAERGAQARGVFHSVGIEDVEDLWGNLAAAMGAAHHTE